MKITTIAYSYELNAGKYAALSEQAKRLGRVRSESWQRFGSVSGAKLQERKVRDGFVIEKKDFGVPANAWKETLRDSFGDMKAYREAAKEKVKTDLRSKYRDKSSLNLAYKNLGSMNFEDGFVRRKMRKYYRHGVNHTTNQIVVRSDDYTVFELGGKMWLKISSLEKGKRIAIPLNTINPKKAELRTKVFTATHTLVAKAGKIIVEDLSAPMAGKKFSKDMNRRLGSWCKSLMVESLKSVSQRRGSSLAHINPAYTSQMDSRNGLLLGDRRGEKFYCFDGVVLQADMNAARNVLARHYDEEIHRWMPYKEVKFILQRRTESHRMSLSIQDSSYTPGDRSLTESELPDKHVCPCN